MIVITVNAATGQTSAGQPQHADCTLKLNNQIVGILDTNTRKVTIHPLTSILAIGH